MICAHCDHDIERHFDGLNGPSESCSQCVVEILAGTHPYSDYVDLDDDYTDQLRSARQWACVDFDH
jgi:hypothetical protein